MGGHYSCSNRQNDALIIPWPPSESAWKSCALGRMLNHFLTRDLDHESYTHEKGRGKNEQQITKWKEHPQPEKNTTRRKAIYPIKKKKPIELPCSSWRSPLSLCHSSCSAGRRQQEGSVTPPPPPPSRDPCSRRPESGSNPQQRRGILGYLTKLATDKAQPTSRPAATSRAKIGFFFRRRNHQPCNQWELTEQNNPRISPRRQCSCRRPPRHLSP